MKFRQLSTGTVLTTENEAVIEMMTASPDYVVVEDTPKAAKPAKKATSPAE